MLGQIILSELYNGFVGCLERRKLKGVSGVLNGFGKSRKVSILRLLKLRFELNN